MTDKKEMIKKIEPPPIDKEPYKEGFDDAVLLIMNELKRQSLFYKQRNTIVAYQTCEFLKIAFTRLLQEDLKIEDC